MAQHKQLTPLDTPARTLPVRCNTISGESFTSYMERLAAAYEAPIATLLSATGLVTARGLPTIPGWGVVMSGDQIEEFCRATRLSADDVSKLLLSSYSGTFGDLSDVDPSVPSSVRRAAVREWMKINRSGFCPQCLAQEPRGWLLRWKLPWSFACVAHRALLRNHCQGCSRPSGMGRGDMTATPAYLGQVVSSGCCRNVRLAGECDRGSKSAPCGAPLWTQGFATLPEQGRALRAQAAIDQQVDAAQSLANVADAECQLTQQAIRGFAEETRSLAALMLLCAEPELFCQESPELQGAVTAHLDQRDRLAKDRSERGMSGPRRRAYTRSGIDPALAAAVLTPAVEIVRLAEHGAMVDALIPLARSARMHSSSHNRQLGRDFGFSVRLTQVFRDATAATGSFGRVSHKYPSVQAADPGGSFGPRHVPQLMPEAVFAEHFQQMLPGVLPLSGRRFCAMAAVKTFGLTWADAAAHLELPEQAARFSTKAVPLINSQGLERRFLDAVAAWVQVLQAQSTPIDFQKRRLKLRHLDDLPPRMWGRVCREAEIRKGERGRRSRYAAAWLWAELTQGDWRLSPAMHALDDVGNAHDIYGRLIKKQLAQALGPLRLAGQALL